ncbi:aminotransferase class V-fold PLP-dependent enzyme [Mucisphaera sp.]|uniref:aminotransferase class V-fold PLP-dependent enzyme n=1 Tax=Mucisphaera sp. TaxID=2913024 RepID=UPI003D1325C2
MPAYDDSQNILYLDHAATSWPKSETMLTAMADFARHEAGNPGRAGHRLSTAAQSVMDRTRTVLVRLMRVPDPSHVVFTHNGTDALNLTIQGVLPETPADPKPHVVTTTLEHNATSRVLETLHQQNHISLTRVPFNQSGVVEAPALLSTCTDQTKLVVISHASNVLGTLQPIAEIGEQLAATQTLLCVDAAQTAGLVPIDMDSLHIDLLAFSGHKSLAGPTGTGALCLSQRAAEAIHPIRFGGTGGDSKTPTQPHELPHRLEAGTPNTIGLAGLLAAIEPLTDDILTQRLRTERALRTQLLDGLQRIPALQPLGSADSSQTIGILSLTSSLLDAASLASILDGSFHIAARAGLHCSPQVHRQLGLLPDGALRISFGPSNTPEDVDRLLAALAAIHA